MINLLSEETIDQIAAGEVVERPASAVKEMCENAIDAGATRISVEIKEGGISFIRVTDNGCGIARDDLPKAFLRHATSKIKSIEDLQNLDSLGFRGEALSSISAVSQMEVITKEKDSLMGIRLTIHGSVTEDISEVGCPDGTTFIVRNLFFNTPVRRKFLKSVATEGSYVTDVIEHLALSHPEVAFTYINGSKIQLITSGRGELLEVIYKIYGREVTKQLIEVKSPGIYGYIAKPVFVRSNRNFETFFVNGRYIKSTILSGAVEEAYKPFLMQHKFPFAVLNLDLAGGDVDANVHPTKMEVRFSDNQRVYNNVCETIRAALEMREMIPEAVLETKDEKIAIATRSEDPVREISDSLSSNETIATEPFTEVTTDIRDIIGTIAESSITSNVKERPAMPFELSRVLRETASYDETVKGDAELREILTTDEKQLDLFEERILSKKSRDEYRILGQAFKTYWIAEYKEKLLLIDQHAAHEKVLYERFREQFRNSQVYSQQLMPPTIITLDPREEEILKRFMDNFEALGFEIEEFGGKEYAIRALPEHFNTVDPKEMIIEVLDVLSDEESKLSRNLDAMSELVNDRIATMACKAAVKGNNSMSYEEIDALLDELLTLDNPYNCPHGRPTMITLTKGELEKKFKRIV